MATLWTDIPLASSVGNLDEFLVRQPGGSYGLLTMQDLRTAMAAAAYDKYISDTLDDGVWLENFSTWNDTPPTTGMLSDAPGGRALAGLSFPSVAINPSTTIASATLHLQHKDVGGSYTPDLWSIYGDTPQATSFRWSQTSPPPGTAIGSITAIAAPTVDTVTSHDVTTMVQAMVNHVNWSTHDYIRFWCQIDTATPGKLMGFGGPDLAGSTPPRLVIELP
jgi:hypothetical protein